MMVMCRTHTSQHCCCGRLCGVVRGPWELRSGQPADIAKLPDTRLVKGLELHVTKDARTSPEWQDRRGPKRDRSGQTRFPEVVALLGLAVRDSTASDRRTRSALGARKACGAWSQDYSYQTRVASGPGGSSGRTAMMRHNHMEVRHLMDKLYRILQEQGEHQNAM